MKKVIVTGADGFIGKALVKKLLDDGVEVWAITYNSNLSDMSNYRNLHVNCVSFEDYSKLPKIIKERDFDSFFHFAWAGVSKDRDDYEVQMKNVFYAGSVADIATKLRVKRFVFADSSHEFLVSKNSDGKVDCCSIYGTAKHCAQIMCKTIAHNNEMDFIGVLFVNIFGIGDFSSRSTNTILKKIIKNEDLHLIKEDTLYDWTYIDDCINGIITAAEKGKNGKIYYVGNQPRTFGEIMQDVREALKTNVKFEFGVFNDSSYSVLKTAKWLKTRN